MNAKEIAAVMYDRFLEKHPHFWLGIEERTNDAKAAGNYSIPVVDNTFEYATLRNKIVPICTSVGIATREYLELSAKDARHVIRELKAIFWDRFEQIKAQPVVFPDYMIDNAIDLLTRAGYTVICTHERQ